jgi:glucose/arabinose dehydrogenase
MKRWLTIAITTAAMWLVSAQASWALPGGFHETVAFGGLSQPTSMAFAADGRLFILEQCGRVRISVKGKLQATPFAQIKTDCSGERGLLGITLDPSFATNGYVYVYYTVPASPRFNRVARLTVDPANTNVALRGSFKPIMDLNRLSATNHNGGEIQFGRDGKLYIGVGDNAVSSNSQSLNTRLGKVLRINSNGSIPTDNPFYTRASGYNRSIWAIGLRNPFTFAFDPGDGRMNINDVGQSTWEEINRGRAGANYGWPTCEGSCSVAGMTNPLVALNRSTSVAITGGTFNRGRHFPSAYLGDYFFGDYIKNFIKRLTPDGRVISFHTTAKSPVDMAMGPNGKLYYLSIGNGNLYRISYD